MSKSNIVTVVSAFWEGLTAPRSCKSRHECDMLVAKRTKAKKLTEAQLDRMLAESCDASDPVATY